jgi:GTPase SAR1 family protein
MHYTTGEFRKEYTVTIGLEFGSKSVLLDKETSVTLQIWDTVSSLRYHEGRSGSLQVDHSIVLSERSCGFHRVRHK